MELLDDPNGAIPLLTDPLHLSLGSRARPIAGFAWDPEVLDAYVAATADDGAEGRLVAVFDGDSSWNVWEQHPAGDEVVVCLTGQITVIREIDGEHDRVKLGPGEAMINPAGVWHPADLEGPARILPLTPGVGTDHRPR